MSMDDKDIQILKYLLTDARQSARQLSQRLGVSTVTMISRIKKLEEKRSFMGTLFALIMNYLDTTLLQ